MLRCGDGVARLNVLEASLSKLVEERICPPEDKAPQPKSNASRALLSLPPPGASQASPEASEALPPQPDASRALPGSEASEALPESEAFLALPKDIQDKVLSDGSAEQLAFQFFSSFAIKTSQKLPKKRVTFATKKLPEKCVTRLVKLISPISSQDFTSFSRYCSKEGSPLQFWGIYPGLPGQNVENIINFLCSHITKEDQNYPIRRRILLGLLSMAIDTEEARLKSKNGGHGRFRTRVRSIYDDNGVKEKDVAGQRWRRLERGLILAFGNSQNATV